MVSDRVVAMTGGLVWTDNTAGEEIIKVSRAVLSLRETLGTFLFGKIGCNHKHGCGWASIIWGFSLLKWNFCKLSRKMTM